MPDEDFFVVTRAIDVKDWDSLDHEAKEQAARDLWSRTLEIASTTTETQRRYLRDWPDIMRRSAALEKWERRVGHISFCLSLPVVLFLSLAFALGAKQRRMRSWLESGWDSSGLAEMLSVYDALLGVLFLQSGIMLLFGLILLRHFKAPFDTAERLSFQLGARLTVAEEISEQLQTRAGIFLSQHIFENQDWADDFREASTGIRGRLKVATPWRFRLLVLFVLFVQLACIFFHVVVLPGKTDVLVHWVVFVAITPWFLIRPYVFHRRRATDPV